MDGIHGRTNADDVIGERHAVQGCNMDFNDRTVNFHTKKVANGLPLYAVVK